MPYYSLNLTLLVGVDAKNKKSAIKKIDELFQIRQMKSFDVHNIILESEDDIFIEETDREE